MVVASTLRSVSNGHCVDVDDDVSPMAATKPQYRTVRLLDCDFETRKDGATTDNRCRIEGDDFTANEVTNIAVVVVVVAMNVRHSKTMDVACSNLCF